MYPPNLSPSLEQVYKKACDMGIPVISAETISFFQTLFSLIKPQKILEIGCAVGFSSGLFSCLAPNDAEITTIDRYPYMIEKAKENFNLMGINHKVKLLEGDAANILPNLTPHFDFIFLDAAKAQYPFFLPQCLRLLKNNGVLCADDIFLSGMLQKDISQIPRRHRTAHRRMKEFLELTFKSDSLQTSLIPLGGGLLFAVKDPGGGNF